MKSHVLAVVLIALASSALPWVCRGDPVVLNGSFEDPLSSGVDPGGGNFWTSTGPMVFLVSNSSGNGMTQFGNQFLGIASPGSSDAQSISGFLTGQSYVLDLFISNLAGSQGPQLTVTITGAATATGTFNATDIFQEVQLPFTATADGDITLSLIDSGLANIAVDNVTIAAVPEPSTVFAMLLVSSTLAFGVVRRVRRGGAR